MTFAPGRITTEVGRDAMAAVDLAIAALKEAGFEFFIAVEPQIFDAQGRPGLAMSTHASSRVNPWCEENERFLLAILVSMFRRGGLAAGAPVQRFVADSDGTSKPIKGH